MQPDARGLALAFAGSFTGAFALALALVTMSRAWSVALIGTTAYCLAEFMDRAGSAPHAGT